MILRCKEATTFKRIIKYDEINAEYERQMEVLRAKMEQRKVQARLAFEETLRNDTEKTPEEKEADLEKFIED